MKRTVEIGSSYRNNPQVLHSLYFYVYLLKRLYTLVKMGVLLICLGGFKPAVPKNQHLMADIKTIQPQIGRVKM